MLPGGAARRTRFRPSLTPSRDARYDPAAMNRLKVWLYTVLVALAGAAGLFALSRGLTRSTQDQLDRQVSACAAQADARLQLVAEHAGRVAERMARDPALLQALTAEASEAELARALAAAERGDPGEAAGPTVAAVGSRGPARFAHPSPATELEPLLSVAREGRRVEAYLLARGALHQVVALPVGLGAAVAVAVPASAAWLRQARAATSCELTVVAAGKPVASTLPADQAALVARAARAGIGAAVGAGALSPQPLSLPWKLPLPALPLLFAQASAHRVGAIALEGVPAGALVLSQEVAGAMSPIVTYGWVGLAALVLLFLVGFVVGIFVTDGSHVAFPKELLIAADRIGRGDFSARAPVLAGRLGTIAGALNRAAEAAWTPPAPVPPADTGSAPLGVDALSGLPSAAPASPFRASPAAAEPASWAVQREVVASAESVPPPAEQGTAEPPAEEGGASDAAPGEPVEAHGGETAAPANAWLEPPATASRDGGAAPGTAPRPPLRDRTSPDFFGVPPAEPAGYALGDEDEEHWKTVYQDFLRVRTDCGESQEGVTYERFREKLHKNRDQLAERYGCRTVRFQVYVKEGKAALKASPVR